MVPLKRKTVTVDRNRIKFRVSHFTLFDILTAPMQTFEDWLHPTIPLDIWAYLYSVDVAMHGHVLLRVYALKADDLANKKLVENAQINHKNVGCAPYLQSSCLNHWGPT